MHTHLTILPLNFSPAIQSLLAAADLPADDLQAQTSLQLFGIHTGAELIGLIGVERYGTVGLLRSLVVADSVRQQGCGQQLVTHAETWASQQGMESLYLLTTTAADFFIRRGYRVCERTQAPPAIRQTTQYAGVCPASAVLLYKKV